jgi:hypothetical protein
VLPSGPAVGPVSTLAAMLQDVDTRNKSAAVRLEFVDRVHVGLPAPTPVSAVDMGIG